MFRKLILSGLFAIAGMSAVMAQTTDYKKSEFYVGYSNNQVDTGADSGNDIRSFFNDRRSYNGFEGSAVYNINRYFGAKADISGTYRNQRVSSQIVNGTVSFDSNQSLYNFLGGVQVKDNSSEARIKPFAHALIGAGYQKFSIKNATCTNAGGCSSLIFRDFSDTGLAGAIGGGLDVKVGKRVSIRAIQVDYNPIKFNRVNHNVRFGAGIVF